MQSCYCPNCEAMGKELAALKAQPAPVQGPVAKVAEVHMSRYTLEWTNSPLPEGTELFDRPAAQPAPVQLVATIDSLEQEIYENTREFVSLNVMEWLLNRLNTTPPAAQRQCEDDK
jgi:hypothetical protein